MQTAGRRFKITANVETGAASYRIMALQRFNPDFALENGGNSVIQI
jgi:hypothetical protein